MPMQDTIMNRLGHYFQKSKIFLVYCVEYLSCMSSFPRNHGYTTLLFPLGLYLY